jgi:polyphosphate kinase
VPWRIVGSDDKRPRRLNCIDHLLDTVPYVKVEREKPLSSKRSTEFEYSDVGSLNGIRFMPERY